MSMAEEILQVRGLTRRFGPRLAVDGSGLRLAPGDLHALVGPNGAGKTTVLRLVAGLLPCDGVEGRVLGLNLRREARRVAAAVGYVSQRTALHAELTVAETLAFRAEVFGLEHPRRRCAELIALGGLQRYAGTRVGRLSGGWARRVQLAAALVHAPRLLLLDEPAAGLDHAAQGSLWRAVAELAQNGVAVLVNTHDPAEAERCSGVTVLAGGRVAARGAPAELAAALGLEVVEVRGSRDRLDAWRAATLGDPEPWAGGLRLITTRNLAEAAVRAAEVLDLTAERRPARFEHVWPALALGDAASRAAA